MWQASLADEHVFIAIEELEQHDEATFNVVRPSRSDMNRCWRPPWRRISLPLDVASKFLSDGDHRTTFLRLLLGARFPQAAA
jgi:hypothetical protein